MQFVMFGVGVVDGQVCFVEYFYVVLVEVFVSIGQGYLLGVVVEQRNVQFGFQLFEVEVDYCMCLVEGVGGGVEGIVVDYGVKGFEVVEVDYGR